MTAMAIQSPSLICFLCDEGTIRSGERLVRSTIPLSQTTLMAKIEQLLGENFMIVVGQDDELCIRCYRMLIEFDKLESDLHSVRNTLKSFLNIKYNLENYNFMPSNIRTDEQLDLQEESEDIHIDESLSQEERNEISAEPTSNQIAGGSSKKYRCNVCDFKSHNQAVILGHLKTVHKSTVVFKCASCDKRFGSRITIQRHIAAAHSPATAKPVRYRCGLCSATYPSRPQLVQHFAVHREGSPTETEPGRTELLACDDLPELGLLYAELPPPSPLPPPSGREADEGSVLACSECAFRTTAAGEMRRHLATLHAPRHQCPRCQRLLSSASNLRRHLERHDAAPARCNRCNTTLSDRLTLRLHMQQEHPQLLRAHQAEHADTAVLQTSTNTFCCLTCGKELTSLKSLRRHEQNHERGSGPAECVVCAESCADRLALREHVAQEHGRAARADKRGCAQCDKCPKVFPTERQMQRHVALVHRPPGCRVCGKLVVPAEKLAAHERRHAKQQRLPCPSCPKVFLTPTGLRLHSAVHTGRYRVFCLVCSKGFQSSNTLDEHMACHTKEARYTCEKCGRSFSSKSTLRLHRVWHDTPFPYSCETCGRKFRHTSLLSVHRRRAHTGERPYGCPHCALTFAVSSARNKHVLLHTRRFPHRCARCGHGVTTRSKLARHLARAHADMSMANAPPPTCQYKMVLRPEEMDSPPPSPPLC